VIRVIHIGVSVRAKGGIASVIISLLTELGRDPELRVTAIPTTMYRGKGILFDILLSIVGLLRVFLACFSTPRPILHLHMTSHGSAIRKGIIARLARATHTPFIIHDSGVEYYYNMASDWMRSWLRGTYRRANAVMPISGREKHFVESLTASPMEIIPNAVNLPDQIDRPVGVSNDKTRFLFLGRLVEDKGVFELLEAFATLCRNGNPVHLTLAGNSGVEEVRNWVKVHDLGKLIDVPGWVEGEEKARVFKTADVFVLPSYHEAVPVAIVEAMSYGLPVIATRVGGIPEVVVENETGLFVEPRDVRGLVEAMQRFASDAQLRHRLGQAGRKRAEDRFSLASVCARIKEVYRKVAAEKTW
jgi:glycosyltransferase involved in cell wall biosynthesis